MGLPTELLEGYRRFRFDRYAEEAERYRGLAESQSPRTMVIACADSRVDPATIFGARPGELFVVRNVAAIVPPYEEYGGYHGTSAAIEFAVTSLAVKTIVVMGHGQCGGIAAALAAADSRPVGRFIAPWVAHTRFDVRRFDRVALEVRAYRTFYMARRVGAGTRASPSRLGLNPALVSCTTARVAQRKASPSALLRRTLRSSSGVSIEADLWDCTT